MTYHFAIFYILLFLFSVLAPDIVGATQEESRSADEKSEEGSPLGRVPLGMREEREESSARKRGGWERGLVSLSLLILREGAARTSSSIPLRWQSLSTAREWERGRGRGREWEWEIGRKRAVIYRLADTIPENAAAKCNVDSLYRIRYRICLLRIRNAFEFIICIVFSLYRCVQLSITK